MKRNPLQVLESYIGEGYIAVGYIGYEYGAVTEDGFSRKREKTGRKLPDLAFLLYRPEDMIATDACEPDAFHSPDSPLAGPARSVTSNMDGPEYVRIVERAKKYIQSGDIYQVNLSRRFEVEGHVDAAALFRRLFHVQRVPFGAYIDFGDFQLVSGSMELFLRRKGSTLTTCPIKGTRSRGHSREEDTIRKAELLRSDKERAENLMIVDLMRNDLSRVCRRGSVKVGRLFDVETYATLHQLVSEVEGQVKEGEGVPGILGKVFPPGSVTGAPKKRALEIIDELEPHYRGPYCGVLGIFYPGGDFTLSVGIRTAVVEPDRTTFWTGSGIVWDSDPEAEFVETTLKSRAMTKALGLSEG
ncbi:MAG: anthranilate synthase component I family protein [Candidatus Dadabacteria bacterium]|nr:anthranilate synthase component I family protein [Candidatus Dadabacteria bacterium]